MSEKFEKTTLRVAPFGDKIMLVRFGAKHDVALESRDITSEFWKTLVHYSFFGERPEKGKTIEVSFGGGEETFTMVLTRD